jgi:hypothetical protein
MPYLRNLCRGDSICRHYEQEEEEGQDSKALCGPRKDAVVPGKDGKLIQPCDEIPARSDVASDKYADGQGGEWVHSVYRAARIRRWRFKVADIARGAMQDPCRKALDAALGGVLDRFKTEDSMRGSNEFKVDGNGDNGGSIENGLGHVICYN